MLRVGVIGGGTMGRNHVRILRDLDGMAELAGIAEPDEATRLALRKVGAPLYASPAELIAIERPDAIVVASPTSTHAAVAYEVIAAGCHLLVEKPLAETSADALGIARAARNAGLVLAVGHVERHNAAVIELKRRLDDGALGRAFTANARRLGPFPARIRDVGVVLDLAPHDIDVLRYVLCSEVMRVYAETERRIHTTHEDLVSATLRFENGVVGTIDINWLTPTKVRELTVTGERGMFAVNYLTQDLFFHENDAAETQWEVLRTITGVAEGTMSRLKVARQEPLRAEMIDFLAAIDEGRPPLVSGNDGIAALLVAEAIRSAGVHGVAVHLDEKRRVA